MGLTHVMCSLPLGIQQDLASVDETVSWDVHLIGHEEVSSSVDCLEDIFLWNGKTAPRLTLFKSWQWQQKRHSKHRHTAGHYLAIRKLPIVCLYYLPIPKPNLSSQEFLFRLCRNIETRWTAAWMSTRKSTINIFHQMNYNDVAEFPVTQD